MTVIENAMEVLYKKAMNVRAGSLNDDEIVSSPCVSVCQMDNARVMCIGCLRTLEELRAWSTLDNNGKRAVWRLIEGRLP